MSIYDICSEAKHKVALLVEGDPGRSLGGACSRDVVNVAKLLIHKLNFSPRNIVALFTGDIPVELPIGIELERSTKENLLKRMQEIAGACTEGSVAYFHYSGHGFQIAQNTKNETDGCDEAISAGELTRDDDIYESFVRRMPRGSTLIATLDCCHSGSVLDLPYLWNGVTWKRDTYRSEDPECFAVSFSACTDSQMDSQDVGEISGFGGSLTVALCDSEIVSRPFKSIQHDLESALRALGQKPLLYSSVQF
jgi:hypothetical protein